jgi:excinuclease ABC subunit C
MTTEEENRSRPSTMEILAGEVKHVTTQPGVYVMRDLHQTILYVGKARNLKKRLYSYFQTHRPHDPKTALLLTKVASFETIITNTEKEALILESSLIKRHRPRYNVNLKDDKRYPVLRLNIKDDYPRLTIVRKIQNDGALYFGPYASGGAVRQTVKFINKTFKLCKCRSDKFKQRARPCLNHQMGLCMGPCFSHVAHGDYREAVKEVIAFLRGRTPALIRRVENQMRAAAREQQYERAALLRDKMLALKQTLERQVSVTTDLKDRDVVGLVSEGTWSAFTLLRVRGGFLLGSRHFVFENTVGPEDEQMSTFLVQYYATSLQVPPELVVSHMPAEQTIVEELLHEKSGRRTSLSVPQRGDKEKLVRMALENASHAMHEQRRQKESQLDLLLRLQQRLHLRRLPQRIECFDNSNLSGTGPVSAMVVFENGAPRPDGYRRYILDPSGKSDDYAAMAEVIRRRYRRGDEAQPLPDLLVVDGGKGQLNTAALILGELAMEGAFDLAGIAKRDPSLGESQDKIYLPGRSNPVQFGRDIDLLFFLQRIRDEAHRFAIGFQRKRRQGEALHSLLDDIDGIGPKRKAQLLQRFGGVSQIGQASLEELQALPGITRALAQTIKTRFSENILGDNLD